MTPVQRQKAYMAGKMGKTISNTLPFDPKKPTIILSKKTQPPEEPKKVYYKIPYV